MTVLASPASLKGVLGAVEAAEALVQGFAAAGVGAEPRPIGDGGGGTAEVLAAALGGSWHEAVVAHPHERPVSARWLMLPGRTPVVEASEAIGLPRLRPEELDPMRASSRGLGELIHAALDHHPDELLVCLGDTATVDGGAGLMEVLGGFPVPARAACDVRNPLLGPRGAAQAFGPQKGASPRQVAELEARLSARKSLRPVADLPGAGAAGGLGAPRPRWSSPARARAPVPRVRGRRRASFFRSASTRASAAPCSAAGSSKGYPGPSCTS